MKVSLSKKGSALYWSPVVWTGGLLERQSNAPRNQAKTWGLLRHWPLYRRHIFLAWGTAEVTCGRWHAVYHHHHRKWLTSHLLAHGSHLHWIFHQLHYSAIQYSLTRLLVTESLLEPLNSVLQKKTAEHYPERVSLMTDPRINTTS